MLCCHSVICVSESAICMLSFAFLCFSRYTTCITSSPQCEKQACRKSWIHRNMSNSDGFCAWISWYGTAGCVVDRLPVWTYLDDFNSFLCVFTIARDCCGSVTAHKNDEQLCFSIGDSYFFSLVNFTWIICPVMTSRYLFLVLTLLSIVKNKTHVWCAVFCSTWQLLAVFYSFLTLFWS